MGWSHQLFNIKGIGKKKQNLYRPYESHSYTLWAIASHSNATYSNMGATALVLF